MTENKSEFGELRPKICIIGGSGFYNMEELTDTHKIECENRFGKTSSYVLQGNIGEHKVFMLARHGEGHSCAPADINYRANIWALKELGITHVLSVTACGSLKEEIFPGTFVLVDSFIDRTQGRKQSLYGGEDGLKGVAHIPMEPAFCKRTRKILYNICNTLNYKAFECGTVVTIQGPRFSSKAESLMYRQMGADVVNMTTVPEVCLAKEAGISYAALAMATDYDCWKEDNVVDTPSVIKVLQDNVSRVRKVIIEAIDAIMKENWDDTIKENRETATQCVMGGESIKF